MAATIRLSRHGQTHRPFYHIVVADSRQKRDGRYLERIGHYSPVGVGELVVDQEKAKKWLARGVQQSPTAKKLLRRAGVTSS